MLLRMEKPGWHAYTQLASTALAVVVRRVDGWCVYVGGVPGIRHEEEYLDVMNHGDKQHELVARAICETLFHPSIDPDGLPYTD
jgi:hypothetical protein